MNIVLWVIQIVLALMFLMAGSMKVFQYEKTKESADWVQGASKGLVIFIGTVELLGAIGLIIPAATGILPILTPLAAIGIALIMLFAGIFHISRKESGFFNNLIWFLLALFVAIGRFSIVPLS